MRLPRQWRRKSLFVHQIPYLCVLVLGQPYWWPRPSNLQLFGNCSPFSPKLFEGRSGRFTCSAWHLLILLHQMSQQRQALLQAFFFRETFLFLGCKCLVIKNEAMRSYKLWKGVRRVCEGQKTEFATSWPRKKDSIDESIL